MAKVTLRGKQDEALLLALDIAVGSFQTGGEHEDAEWKADRIRMENLREAIEKQLNLNGGEPSKSTQREALKSIPCQASDSGLMIAKCWCAQCKEEMKNLK